MIRYITKMQKDKKGPPLTWEDKVLLYIFQKGVAWYSDITRNITKHPQRTKRVLDKLLRAGLIQPFYTTIRFNESQRGWDVKMYTLTSRGYEYMRKWLLNGKNTQSDQ